MNPTLKDIAKAAGVHPTVVSVVLNNKQYLRVSPERREQIRRIADEMGYRPNMQAASLRGGKKGAIGVFLPQWRDVLLLEIIKGLSESAAELDLPLSFYFGMSMESYSKFIDSMSSCRNTGIISYVPFWDREYEKILSRLDHYIAHGGQVVSFNTLGWPMSKTITIDIDEHHGGVIAAEYLAAKELRSFGFFGTDMRIHELREAGFRDELTRRNAAGKLISTRISALLETSEAIMPEVGKFLDSLSFPAGIFAPSTDFARFLQIGCMLRQLAPGRDYELVGYDFPPNYGDLKPFARIIQPFRQLGCMAMQELYALLRDEKAESRILLPELFPPDMT